jgi:TolB-like protein/Flp pilus assembly protein TadD
MCGRGHQRHPKVQDRASNHSYKVQPLNGARTPMVEYLRELGRRKMAQWALAYAAGAWVALQVIGLTADSYDWSPVVMRVALGISVIGFLATLVLAWYHGERGEQKTTRTELLILALLLAVGGGVLWNSERGATTSGTPSPTAAPATAAIAEIAINPRSIAVLPFANLSADKDNAYFAEGIQDEILTRLSKVAELKVISRTSTRRYASAPENLPGIARELGVANILEGSVQKVGNSVRITVQLIHAASDTHLWAEIYDRELVDIFAIQSEVTTAIAKSLQATLTANEQRDVAAKLTANTAAYEAYLRGLAADRASDFTTETFDRARDAFQEAVRLDPDFAEAWRRLAHVLSEKYALGTQTPAALAAIKQAVDHTVRLQPGSVNAQLAQGYYRYRALRDYPGALEAFSQVAGREPNNIEALASMAYVQRRLGDMDGALRQLDKAEALDPGNAQLVLTRGEILAAIRRHPEALAALHRALQLNPNDVWAVALQAQANQAQGKLAAAEKVLDSAPSLDQYTQASRLQQAWLSNEPDRYVEACKHYGDFVDAHPDLLKANNKLGCQLQIGYLQHLQGSHALAADTCKSVLEAFGRPRFAISPASDDPTEWAARGMAYACLGDKASALSDMVRAGALANTDKQTAPATELDLAKAQLWLGDEDAAIALLAHSLTVPYGTTVDLLRLDPFWQPLRNDPRFKALLAGR